MKEGIHPEYKETTITCVCGNVINTRSTKKDIKTEICSNCHPFMTGKQRVVDTAGRVEKFKKKYETKAVTPQAKKTKSAETVKKTAKK
ncbi:MAG TPA: 50S ribosomal protein L31 [Smithella sp.]|nr:50S ribosomal protein L31 [Smithella sp.]